MDKSKIFFTILFLIAMANAHYMMNKSMKHMDKQMTLYEEGSEQQYDAEGMPIPKKSVESKTVKTDKKKFNFIEYLKNTDKRVLAWFKGIKDHFKPTVIVYLNNGNAVVGEAVRETKTEVILTQDGSEIAFLKEEVLEINEKGKKKGRKVTLFLKDGGVIMGNLLRETDEEYVLLWQGGEVGFKKEEVDRMKRGDKIKGKEDVVISKEKEIEETKIWEHEDDYVLVLQNQTKLEGSITAVTDQTITLEQELEGGGAIEQDVERETVDYILFKSLLDNKESRQIEERLKTQFPKMRTYTEGNFTIFTDSYITWVKKYRKTLKRTYTELYLNFFTLFEKRKPSVQNFIVIFDDLNDYVEYAATDGIPGMFVAGYFMPDERVLYLPNLLGDTLSNFIKSIFVDQIGSQIDRAADSMAQMAGDHYKLAIEGMSEDLKKRFWEYHDLITAELRHETFRTLRHEFVHSVLSNWGIQGIITSKPKVNRKQLAAEKREFLDTNDPQKKQEVLEKLMKIRKDEHNIEMEADNSWFVEGLATYCETLPFGADNEFWLYTVQKMIREDAIMPFEQLSVYKLGSFPGVYPDAMIEAYSQSWAFVTFLMNKYPEAFISYLEKMIGGGAKGHEDYEWLFESIGKDIRTVEAEFIEFMKKYPELEDPFFKRFDQVRKIFTSF